MVIKLPSMVLRTMFCWYQRPRSSQPVNLMNSSTFLVMASLNSQSEGRTRLSLQLKLMICVFLPNEPVDMVVCPGGVSLLTCPTQELV